MKVVDTDKAAVATRVLIAVSKHQEPDECDVGLLHACYPDYPKMDPDEIACIVIQEQMHKMRDAYKIRASASGL